MAKTMNPALDPDQDYRSAMQALIATRWAAVWEAVPVALAGEDPEGVHDVRVASRRVRAAMDVATDCFPKPWYRSLHRTAKEITRALGDVRDRDVLLEALATERKRAKVAERPGIDELIARIERERDEARERMVAFLTDLDARGVREETLRRFPPPGEDDPKANTSNAASARSNGRAPAEQHQEMEETRS
ncbi:MAG TPA: CHAD domain-containing protein [Thermomicrobiales bacterium]|nr:CHAD domain-containing protein [Thermomicrobiales bacterium]